MRQPPRRAHTEYSLQEKTNRASSPTADIQLTTRLGLWSTTKRFRVRIQAMLNGLSNFTI